MPKKKARRFEPRWGVSQAALVEEAKFVVKEVDDYLLLSLNDLKAKLKELREKWEHSTAAAEAVMNELPDRTKLAIQCLVHRDCWYVLELYSECLKQIPSHTTIGPKQSIEDDKPMMPQLFNESLFPT